MTKRHLLGHLLGIVPFETVRAMRLLHRGRHLTILTYHRVMDRPDYFPFDEDLISASTRQFRSHLDFVTKHFDVINFRMLDEYMEKNGTLPPRALIITFDDGYRDNHEVAWPILKEYGVTATMFVTAGFIGRRRMFWWDRIAYIVKTSSKRDARVDIPRSAPIDLGAFPDRQSAARRLIRTVKNLPDGEKEDFIGRFAGIMEVSLNEDEHALTMSWDQVRELIAGGIEIGGHSVNHPIFSNTGEERLREEVSGAKKIIEEQTGGRVITFGSPGRGILTAEEKPIFERRLRSVIAESGYKFCTMYRWGLGYEKGFEPYGVPRISIESHDTDRLFKVKLAYPELLTY